MKRSGVTEDTRFSLPAAFPCIIQTLTAARSIAALSRGLKIALLRVNRLIM